MKSDPLDALLARLTCGDVAAAETVFRAYEPYLRKVVRRQLPARMRAKFDSVDVVQSVWADLIDGFRHNGWRFADVAQLRTFLYRVTRNRFIDRCRHHDALVAHEQPLAATDVERLPATPDPAPDDALQADDLWARMLAACPPAYHDLLRYKRDGLPLAEIVVRTGLHEGSIRRILRNLARRLALNKC